MNHNRLDSTIETITPPHQLTNGSPASDASTEEKETIYSFLGRHNITTSYAKDCPEPWNAWIATKELYQWISESGTTDVGQGWTMMDAIHDLAKKLRLEGQEKVDW